MSEAGRPGAEALERLSRRLEELATELDGDPAEERVSQLIQEAADLAAQAGKEVDRSMREASGPGAPPPQAS